MNDVWEAATVGTAAGLLTTASVLLIEDVYYRGRLDAGAAISILIAVAMIGGLGALLASRIVAGWLLKRIRRGQARGRILALGILFGLPAGFLQLLLFALVMTREPVHLVYLLRAPWALTMLAAATAGSGIMGLGCAWSLTRSPEVPE